MTRMLSVRGALVIASILAAPSGVREAAAQEPKQQGIASASVKVIAEQLGARLQPRDDDDLGIGSSFTATLETPEKLAEFGIKGMHAGARVSVARVAPDKIRLEVDEMDPVPARGSATVKLDAKGALIPIGKG